MAENLYTHESRPVFAGRFTASVVRTITKKSYKAKTYRRTVEFLFSYPPYGRYWFVVDEQKIGPKRDGDKVKFVGSIFPIKNCDPDLSWGGSRWSKFKPVAPKDLASEQYWKVAQVNPKGQARFIQGTFRGTPEEIQEQFGFSPIHFEIQRFGRLDLENEKRVLFWRVFPE